jgi:hypothetical protein
MYRRNVLVRKPDLYDLLAVACQYNGSDDIDKSYSILAIPCATKVRI